MLVQSHLDLVSYTFVTHSVAVLSARPARVVMLVSRVWELLEQPSNLFHSRFQCTRNIQARMY